MRWTPNKVTLLRVVVGFAAVCLFGRGAWANLTAVGLTVATIALDALDGHIARLEGEYQKKETELQALRVVATEYDNVAAGVLGQVAPEEPAQGHDGEEEEGGEGDEELQAFSKQEGELAGQLIGIHTRAFSKIYALLTPEQRTKAEELHQRFMSRLREHFGSGFAR